MSTVLHPYDVRADLDIQEPLDFNRRAELKHVDQVFKAEITNIVSLTEMEKLFHLRIVDKAERERFSFRPGQFVMLELPGIGEVPISISGSPNWRGHIELCIRRAGIVTGVLHKAERGALVGIRGPFGTAFPMAAMKDHDVLLIAGGLGSTTAGTSRTCTSSTARRHRRTCCSPTSSTPGAPSTTSTCR
jgi:hypothetical protein